MVNIPVIISPAFWAFSFLSHASGFLHKSIQIQIRFPRLAKCVPVCANVIFETSLCHCVF